MSELTIKDKVDPRKLPTKLLVDTYKETGSYRQAAKKLGVSVQFLYQRIKKHGSKDITTKEFINYHAMTREEIESFIESAITEARIDELQSTSDKLVKLGVPVAEYDDPKGYSKVGHMFADRIAQLNDNTTKQEDINGTN